MKHGLRWKNALTSQVTWTSAPLCLRACEAVPYCLPVQRSQPSFQQPENVSPRMSRWDKRVPSSSSLQGFHTVHLGNGSPPSPPALKGQGWQMPHQQTVINSILEVVMWRMGLSKLAQSQVLWIVTFWRIISIFWGSLKCIISCICVLSMALGDRDRTIPNPPKKKELK